MEPVFVNMKAKYFSDKIRKQHGLTVYFYPKCQETKKKGSNLSPSLQEKRKMQIKEKIKLLTTILSVEKYSEC